MAGLKAINDKAAIFGTAVRDLVNSHVALANKIVADGAKLPSMLAAHALSGGVLPDSIAIREHVQALFEAVPVPSDAEIDAASAGVLDGADRGNVRAAIVGEAVLRYVIGFTRDRQPANDV